MPVINKKTIMNVSDLQVQKPSENKSTVTPSTVKEHKRLVKISKEQSEKQKKDFVDRIDEKLDNYD